MRVRAWIWAVCGIPCAALASSHVARSLAERAKDADRVVLAQVIDSSVRVPGGDVRQMTTVTTLAVREHYKGAPAERLEVVQLGGTYGLWETRFAGDAVFDPGETVLVFLRCRDPSVPQRCNLVDLGAGKLRVEFQGARQAVDDRGRQRALESIVDEVRQAPRLAVPVRGGKR